MNTSKIKSVIENTTGTCIRYGLPVAALATSTAIVIGINKIFGMENTFDANVGKVTSILFGGPTAGALAYYGFTTLKETYEKFNDGFSEYKQKWENFIQQKQVEADKEIQKREVKIAELEKTISERDAMPNAIYQFESQPMTVEAARARVANIECILTEYKGHVTNTNFTSYPTRKTQVQMKDLLDKKNLLVEPEEFIAGVITVSGQDYASQVKGTIESMLPMKQSALTYQGKSLDEKVEETTKK